MIIKTKKSSKLVGFMGAPGTGKTILACALKEEAQARKDLVWEVLKEKR